MAAAAAAVHNRPTTWEEKKGRAKRVHLQAPQKFPARPAAAASGWPPLQPVVGRRPQEPLRPAAPGRRPAPPVAPRAAPGRRAAGASWRRGRRRLAGAPSAAAATRASGTATGAARWRRQPPERQAALQEGGRIRSEQGQKYLYMLSHKQIAACTLHAPLTFPE